MATIQFNEANFRSLFPAFAGVTAYPSSFLNLMWTNATSYLSDQTQCGWYGGMTLAQQTLSLNYMTAHLVALSKLAAAGQNPGIETQATIDKISVSIMPPPAASQWQYWLQTTPYGAQLLALLQVLAAGGRFYNGAPVYTAFRR